MTINEAIKKVILEYGSPMTADGAYQAIIDKNLYEFHANNPAHVVRSQIRRHCEGLDFLSAAPTKHFKLVGENRYWPLDQPSRSKRTPIRKKVARRAPARSKGPMANSFKELQFLYGRYIAELKKKIINDLKRLSPAAFEVFAKRLLDVYGFHEMKVTQVSGDGGIDGYGKLKVGLAYLNVAFQCKRWSKGNVQRPEVDKFRGAIQGDFEQGLFFTTTSFSEGAIEVSIKRGAVPIVLVDGEAIVDLMIERNFGVQVESLSIPSYALDLAFDLPTNE
ncbi:MAG: restriction endonuclease [Nitrospirae bacterium]|nr:restriction endonuclease [Nitrospirota bacterium]